VALKENIRLIILIALAFALVETFVLYKKYDTPQFEGSIIQPSPVDYWKVFEGISKERTYVEEVGAYYRIPIFTEELLALSGEEITLSGYYLPYSRLDSVIILSRYPNASCFFCGQAGIESVAMIELGSEDADLYRMDEMLLVQGKLSLNSSDIDKLAFVLTDAIIERRGL